MRNKLLTKKLFSFLAVGLSLVTFATSLLGSIKLPNKQSALTAQADELDDEEDTRFVQAISTIFPESDASLVTETEPSLAPETEEDELIWVSFSGTTCILNGEPITFEGVFDSEDMTFTVVVSDDYGVMETIESEAFVNSKGGLGSIIEVNALGETFSLDNYKDDKALSDLAEAIVNGDDNIFEDTNSNARSMLNSGFLRRIIAVVIVVYVIVAETAEQIKAELNYDYNSDLEMSGEGQIFGVKIWSQSSRACAGYRFGFFTFDKRGCEVASIYNLQIALGNPQMLSQVIYDFEKWAIEFSVGWGWLGSNPREIYRYLQNHNIPYQKYTVAEEFYNAVADSSYENYILSRTNVPFLEQGLHTFYVCLRYANNGNPYYHAENNTREDVINMDAYVQGEQEFLVGYIILE